MDIYHIQVVMQVFSVMKLNYSYLQEIPMVRLKGTGKEADLELTEMRLPILPCDVQNLLLQSQLGMDCPRFPRYANKLTIKSLIIVCSFFTKALLTEHSSVPFTLALI